MIKTDFHYYLSHQAELVKKHNGKHIVIKDEKVIGEYEDLLTAYRETKKIHKPGTFIIQLCTPGDEAYTQRFYSMRVIF